MNKIYLTVSTCVALVQVTLGTTTAMAQNDAKGKKDTTRNLNAVIVTASRSPKRQSEIGRVVTVISRDEISRSQGKSLPEVLNNVAGITFSGAQNSPGISSSVYLRGASVGNTLILINGFPVNNASSIDGSYDLNALSLDQIDHIEILKGSGSTLYGSDAVAGVINIITKQPQNKDLTGNIQLSGGSYRTYKQSVGLNGRINNTGISLNVSNLESAGFASATDTLGTLGFRKNSYNQQAVSLNLNQYVNSKFILNGNFQATYNTGNLPYGAFTNDNDFGYSNTFLFGGLGANLILPKGNLLLNVTQNTVWNNYNNFPSDNNQTTQTTRNIGRITNAESVFSYGLSNHFDITSGASFKYSNTSQYSYYDQPYYHPGPITFGKYNNIASGYTSLFYKSDIFNMELGGRYNRHSLYGNNFTYTINPSVILAHQFKVFGTIASAYKVPTLYQLFSQYGNINLKPEKTTSYEAGFDWQIVTNTLSFNTVFYKRKTKDVIYFYTDPLTYKSYYKNGNLEDDKGFESELKLNLDKVTASAYAAYVTGTQTDTKDVDTHNLLRRPRNTYGASLSYQFIKAASVGLVYKYTGERSDTHFLDVSPYSRVEGLKAYNLVDAHIQANATRKLSLFVDLKNLFDVKYIDWIGYNTRGFNVYGGIKYILD